MSQITIDDIRRILRECAGDGENNLLSGDIMDRDFDDLGYDSLAVIETVARISREFGVQIPDDMITELRTPGQLLGQVNNAVGTT